MNFCIACGSDFFDRTTEENGARLHGNHNVPEKKGVMSIPLRFRPPKVAVIVVLALCRHSTQDWGFPGREKSC